MEHPLIEVDPKLTLDELQNKINELTKKLGYAHRTNNRYLADQIRLALSSFQSRYQQRIQEQYDAAKKSGSDFSDRIDIS
jgi:hypothetical protein